jgi:hypothetical protein
MEGQELYLDFDKLIEALEYVKSRKDDIVFIDYPFETIAEDHVIRGYKDCYGKLFISDIRRMPKAPITLIRNVA